MMKNLPFPSLLILSIFFVLPFSQGYSQQMTRELVEEIAPDNSRMGIMDVGFYYANPLDEFKADGYKQGFGVNLGILSRAFSADNRLAALRVGGRMTIDMSGRSEGDLVAQLPDSDLFGEMHLTNSSIGLFGLARIETAPQFPVQLYVEGLIGSRRLFTSESFNEHEDYEEAQCIENTVLSDWSLAYGASAGTLIRLGQRTRLDLRATYMTSTPSRFVNLATAQQVEDNLYQYQTEVAPASQVQLQAGVSFDMDFRCAPSRSSLVGGGCELVPALR